MNILCLEILVCSLLIGTYATYETEKWNPRCPQLFYQETPPFISYHGSFGMCRTIYRCFCEKFKGKDYFASYYNTNDKVPIFSAYKVDTFGKVDNKMNVTSKRKWRKSHNIEFRVQPLIKDYAEIRADDLDRGHLAPRLYFSTYEGRRATDVLTNIALQYRLVNRYTWRTLEKSTFVHSRDHCQKYGGKSYFITGTIPGSFEFFKVKQFFKVKNSTTKINIPYYFWTAVCCDTSNASYANRYKGWSYAYIVENSKSGLGTFDVMTVEAFLRHPEFQYRYRDFSLFNNILVPDEDGDDRFVGNCLFDPNKADILINRIRQDYEKTLVKVQTKTSTIHTLLEIEDRIGSTDSRTFTRPSFGLFPYKGQ